MWMRARTLTVFALAFAPLSEYALSKIIMNWLNLLRSFRAAEWLISGNQDLLELSYHCNNACPRFHKKRALTMLKLSKDASNGLIKGRQRSSLPWR